MQISQETVFYRHPSDVADVLPNSTAKSSEWLLQWTPLLLHCYPHDSQWCTGHTISFIFYSRHQHW